jgi:hypothetical protein
LSLHASEEHEDEDLKAALKLHGLATDEPSQLSDAFRLGWKRRSYDVERYKAEVEKLQEALRRYGDKSRMGTVYPESLQQAIDRAFGDTSTEI